MTVGDLAGVPFLYHVRVAWRTWDRPGVPEHLSGSVPVTSWGIVRDTEAALARAIAEARAIDPAFVPPARENQLRCLPSEQVWDQTPHAGRMIAVVNGGWNALVVDDADRRLWCVSLAALQVVEVEVPCP